MVNPYLTQSFPPLRLSAARRILETMTVELDMPGYLRTSEIHARIRISPTDDPLSLTLISDGKDLLANCPVCRTREDLPCAHAIAVLLLFRERMDKGKILPPLPIGSGSTSPSRSVRQSVTHFHDFPCQTLLLAGSRKAPFFVTLTHQQTPMSHIDFQRLDESRRSGTRSIDTAADLFCRAFDPFDARTSDGRSVPGYRPKSGNPDELFRYLALPGLRVLSARTKQVYRLERPDHRPEIRFSAQWSDHPGGALLLGGEIVLNKTSRPLKETLWITFETLSVLCGNGSLVFLSREDSGPPLLRRLVEIAGESRPLGREEWAPLLEPLMTEPTLLCLLNFSDPETAPRFGDRSRWRAAVRVAGRAEGSLLLTPECRYGDLSTIPLFGPERHRLGNYILGERPSEQTPFLIGRDREKELLARNLFEKLARLSSPSASIPVDPMDAEEILDRVLPELESQGFLIDKSALHEGSILPGPIHIALDVSDHSPDNLLLKGQILTESGIFPLPGRSPGDNSSLLPLSSGVSVYLEGTARAHDREISQLFVLDEKGSGLASRFYVSMIRTLRPDLPIRPDPGLELLPFLPSSLSEDHFSRLGKYCRADLRPYQKEAVSFLASLYREGLSGILADEMGLGKTISILGFLAHLKRENLHSQDLRPPIAVLPASLIYNWAHEVERFCPTLRIHLHTGSTRQMRIKEMEGADLLLTTYGTLRNDPHLASGPSFSCLILDEAHTVKNPDSLTHQALLELPARMKIAVTGTPVENRITDLWGLMNLLMPGLLGSRLQFERRFLRAKEAGEEQNRRIDLLRNLVAPLILRRTKDMVLSELPPKVEVDIWVDPSSKEREQYHRIRTQGRHALLSLDGPLHLAYLTLLLRLRQFACHPDLLPPEMNVNVGRSSKFELVCEKISEGVSEGHKILLFSQFTRVLDLFEEALFKQGVSYVRLDGSTPLEERKRRVDAFQSDAPDAPMVFLASLKAGGVGLTLTRADYVFHYDPWWNPQVEAQASDRSHRIGQTKTVFIYRFLMRDTVEERVQTLKESKREMFLRLMNGVSGASSEDHFSGELSLDEMRDLIDAESSDSDSSRPFREDEPPEDGVK